MTGSTEMALLSALVYWKSRVFISLLLRRVEPEMPLNVWKPFCLSFHRLPRWPTESSWRRNPKSWIHRNPTPTMPPQSQRNVNWPTKRCSKLAKEWPLTSKSVKLSIELQKFVMSSKKFELAISSSCFIPFYWCWCFHPGELKPRRDKSGSSSRDFLHPSLE